MRTAALRVMRLIVTYRLALMLLIVVNVAHTIIHGTPLDQGALDSVIDNVDNWLISQAVL